MTTEDLMELRELAEAVRDAELPHPKWLAENSFKAAFNYGTAIELLDALEALGREVDALKQQAQIWKMEAETQKATVHEIYQLCTGATGEPGNWNGAAPVREVIAERDTLRAELAAIRAQKPIGCGYVVKWEKGDTPSTYQTGYAQVLDVPVYASPVSPVTGVDVNAGLVEALETLIPMFAQWHEEFPEHIGDKEAPALARAIAALSLSQSQPAHAGVAEDAARYYLQDTRSYVGNCPLWWALGGNGYTTDLRKAERYTLEDALRQHHSRGTDLPWLCSEIDAVQRPTVDMQDVHKLRSNTEQKASLLAAAPQQKKEG